MLGDRFEPLLARAQESDREAFAELWRESHPMLLRYLRVIAGVDAEDLASQTWLRVIGSLGTFQGTEAQFRRWLVTIARNLHVDQLRRSSRRSELLVADPVDVSGTVPDAAAVAEEQMSTEQALRLIAQLPAAQAEMVMLRVVLGLDVADVAEVVGRTSGAVRVAVHRGLRRLERMLAEPPGVTGTDAESFSEHDG